MSINAALSRFDLNLPQTSAALTRAAEMNRRIAAAYSKHSPKSRWIKYYNARADACLARLEKMQ